MASTIKIKKMILAIPAAASETPPKPKIPAIINCDNNKNNHPT